MEHGSDRILGYTCEIGRWTCLHRPIRKADGQTTLSPK